MDYEKAEKNALESTFSDFGLPYKPEYLDSYKKINAAYWKLFEKGDISLEDLRVNRFSEFFKEQNLQAVPKDVSGRYLRHLGQGAFLLDGAEKVLNHLHARFTLAIITNGIPEVQRSRFQLVNIGRFFKEIIISEEIGSSKPNTEFFRITSEKLGISDPASALVVGDSLASDILGGNNYGMNTCWYNPQNLPRNPDIKPTYEIKDLADLLHLVGEG